MRSETCITEGGGTYNSGNAKRIMIVAGEASGDLHGGNLVKAMRQLDSTLRFCGVGGKHLKEAGVDLVANSADMAVVGFTEVFSKLGTIRKVMGALKDSIKKACPDLLILIDYPDFNLSLAKAAKKNGVKIFYYISPQVWAWRKGRIGTIKRIVDTMAVILPFEAPLYHEAGVEATFVGHPLLDVVRTNYSRQEALRRFSLKENTKTIAILPGSRKSEVTRILPEMLQAAQIITRQLSSVQFVLPIADTLDMTFISDIIDQYPVTVRIVPNQIYDVLGCADIAMVASGTATLETALLETPMVIIYKISAPSYYIGKIMIHVHHIGLVNIIAGKTVVPELIQDEANPEKIAAEVMDILENEGRRNQIKKELSKIKALLGSPGASERAARLAYDMLSL